jgi:hypothetical protein
VERPLPGLLADVNLRGHLPYLERKIADLGLLNLLRKDLGLDFLTFAKLGLQPNLDDRSLWLFCQEHEWVLITDNRNQEDEDSLQATLTDLWFEGKLPVLTLASKRTFETSSRYALIVAEEVAEILFATFQENVRDQARIFVPRNWNPETH